LQPHGCLLDELLLLLLLLTSASCVAERSS
jgi:hypothetical protein